MGGGGNYNEWLPTAAYPPPPPPYYSTIEDNPSSSSSIHVNGHILLIVIIALVIVAVFAFICAKLFSACIKGCEEAGNELCTCKPPDPPAPPAPPKEEKIVYVCTCYGDGYRCCNFHCNYCGACCKSACHCGNRFYC